MSSTEYRISKMGKSSGCLMYAIYAVVLSIILLIAVASTFKILEEFGKMSNTMSTIITVSAWLLFLVIVIFCFIRYRKRASFFVSLDFKNFTIGNNKKVKNSLTQI